MNWNEEQSNQQSYDEKFIMDGINQLKIGHETFIYKKEMLDKFTKRLEEYKIKYKAIERDGYWIIRNGEKKCKPSKV